jgi:uncharacterized phage protein (TIGR01671 family)
MREVSDMREILFRGRRIDNGDWIEGFYFEKPNPCSEDGLPKYHGISDLPPFGAEVVPETVSQFTGLIDKNGRKVFEGDVLAMTDCDGKEHIEGIVAYGEFNCACCEGVYGWYVSGFGDIRLFDRKDVPLYVIGSMYDDLKLLEALRSKGYKEGETKFYNVICGKILADREKEKGGE